MTSPLFTAAEVSGDRLAGPVLSALAARAPGVRWQGIGGSSMAASAHHDAFGSVDVLGGAGLVELLPRLPALWAARRALRAAVDDRPPLAVFVDAPDLHLPLAARSRSLGVPTVLLVVPQFWAWRPGRRQTVADVADLALCLFEHEVAPLRSLGVAAFHVGHPAAELPLVPPKRARRLRIAVLPGSRRSEVHRHLTPFLRAVSSLENIDTEVAWRLREPPPSREGVIFSTEPGTEVLARADAALVAPGTASLQACVLGVPTVVAGALHPLSAVVARRLLAVESVALPNLLLGRAAVPEILQDLDASRLLPPLRALLDDPSGARQRAIGLAEELRQTLGRGGFAERAAERILPLLGAA
jgi:lipid-A-disaccharide synthase